MLTAEPRRHLVQHPLGYNPGVPRVPTARSLRALVSERAWAVERVFESEDDDEIVARLSTTLRKDLLPPRQQPSISTSRQMQRAALRDAIGASSFAQAARRGRTIRFATNSSELNDYLTSTAVGGDIIVVSKSTVTTYNIEVVPKAGEGTADGDLITVIVEDYAVNFQPYTAARIGVDEANCAKFTVVNGDNQAPIINGGLGSYYALYGINFDDALPAGTAKVRGLVRIGLHPEEGSIYSNSKTAQAGSPTTITLDATETINWASHLGSFVLVFDSAPPETRVIVGRGTITAYDSGTKVATCAAGWTGTAPTTGSTYSITRAQIDQTQYGRARFRHCLFSGADCGNDHALLAVETSGCVIEDCDFLSHSRAGTGENKGIVTTSGQGAGGLTIINNRIRNASVGIFLFSYAGPVIPANSFGTTIRYNNILCDDFTDAANMKTLIEIKGGANITIEKNVLHGAWPGGQVGGALNISLSGNSDTAVLNTIVFQDNYVYDTAVFGGTGGSFGGAPEILYDVIIRRNLIITGYDIRNGADATTVVFGLSSAHNLELAHNTVVGNHASRMISKGPMRFDEGTNKMPGLHVHGNVTAEPTAQIFTIPVGSNVGKVGFDTACGVGQWTFTANAICLSDADAVTTYDDPPLDHTDLIQGAGVGAAQAILDAAWNPSTYQMLDTAYTDPTDGLIDGVPSIAALMAHVAGVEAGVPEELQEADAGATRQPVNPVHIVRRLWPRQPPRGRR